MSAPADEKISDAKRKRNAESATEPDSSKRIRTKNAPTVNNALLGPHNAIVKELSPKYDLLPFSVISSSKIHKRIASVLQHLLNQTDKPRVVLLYARKEDVCKLITVVQQCKRVLREEGKAWYQYNQLFDEPDRPKKRDLVEETVLQNEASDGSDDDFEVMQSRFEDAVMPTPSNRTVKSLRVFLSIEPVQELKAKENMTLQSTEEKRV